MSKLFKTLLLAVLGIFVLQESARADSALEIIKDIQIHGFASSSYTYNFNDPNTGNNANRIFDTDHNSFKFDVGELVLLKETSNPGEVGFRTDVTYGFSLPEVTKSTPAAPAVGGTDVSDDDFDLQQGYVSYNAPIGSGIQIDMGKFITHVGAEVIEGYDGWNNNFSRSFLFGLAIPFTHTGVRAGYTINDDLSVMGMVANGWDNTTDNNDAKTLGVQVAYAPINNISMLFNWAGGPEQTNNNDNWRHVLDVVIDAGLTDSTALQLNFDYAVESNHPSISSQLDASWWGFAGIIRHDYNKWFSINLRGEYFDDSDGVRANVATGQELWEITVTPEFRINQNLVVRFEYRHDESNSDLAFSSNNTGSTSDNQDTLAVNALFHF